MGRDSFKPQEVCGNAIVKSFILNANARAMLLHERSLGNFDQTQHRTMVNLEHYQSAAKTSKRESIIGYCWLQAMKYESYFLSAPKDNFISIWLGYSQIAPSDYFR